MCGRLRIGRKLAYSSKLLAQFDVDAGKAAANRRGDRSFQAYAGAFDGFVQLFGNVFLVFLKGFGARRESFPLKFHAGGFQNANRRLRDFRPDAVAGDERDLMRHK